MAKKNEQPDSGHYSQFADRTACIMHMIQELLIENPVTDELVNFKATLVSIKDLLEDLAKESKAHVIEGDTYFDLGDRAYCFFSMTNELLVEDKELMKDKKSVAYARSAANRFWQLYQHLGAKLTADELKEVESLKFPKAKSKKA